MKLPEKKKIRADNKKTYAAYWIADKEEIIPGYVPLSKSEEITQRMSEAS